ncbi:hypothetical protein BACCIP111895_00258 [Neobacillus rhizosphaerae]|uniref:Insertion element IS150 protein InsJ-like helix-turn-helix domain-containing protein n=1 Tax=Neobacillus rhizosphaerae TaxID=2880965 RepID=A0ABN8KJL7_9BACI|nr:transposase [Neobacillus rhizosphaerae]CAH2713125.1 hypothetical protein BACCIP111895_00258 [Neobacillus rhizosphaerae]
MSRANKQYPNDLKLKAVQVYLAREGSYQKIAEEYNIRNASQVKDWVQKYK